MYQYTKRTYIKIIQNAKRTYIKICILINNKYFNNIKTFGWTEDSALTF